MADGDSRRPARRPRLEIDVVHARSLRASGLAPWLTRVAPAGARGSMTVALVGDARMRALNRTYRGKDAATDVLSFPGETSPGSARGRQVGPLDHLGDVVIATGVARRQARDAGHSVQTEIRILALHGLLHLLGYDHETDTGEMARAERRLLRRAGLRDGLIERGGEDAR